VQELAPVCEKVFFTFQNGAEAAETLKRELASPTTLIVPVQADLRDTSAWDQVLQQLVDEEEIDLLVNAAGVSVDGLCIEVTPDAFLEQYQVNVFAAWRAMSVIGRDMVFHRRGRIINIASIAATLNSPGRSAYASTKAALVSLTKSFAVELGRFGVRVNAVSPGFVETDMIESFDEATRKRFTDQIPLGRFASASDVARTVKYLATPDAAYLHGAVITVDGGTTA
jgi:3-oxoacyl-[acyl-carrier protein] reductase